MLQEFPPPLYTYVCVHLLQVDNAAETISEHLLLHYVFISNDGLTLQIKPPQTAGTQHASQNESGADSSTLTSDEAQDSPLGQPSNLSRIPQIPTHNSEMPAQLTASTTSAPPRSPTHSLRSSARPGKVLHQPTKPAPRIVLPPDNLLCDSSSTFERCSLTCDSTKLVSTANRDVPTGPGRPAAPNDGRSGSTSEIIDGVVEEGVSVQSSRTHTVRIEVYDGTNPGDVLRYATNLRIRVVDPLTGSVWRVADLHEEWLAPQLEEFGLLSLLEPSREPELIEFLTWNVDVHPSQLGVECTEPGSPSSHRRRCSAGYTSATSTTRAAEESTDASQLPMLVTEDTLLHAGTARTHTVEN
eukprot:GHVQ01034610.1.p1 GENE.GHVQ01034610.1~~GHVQ01034610.1.p1  ORF type:complete len:356 (+),score=44.00 GHVQ01034610.1:303-1370(+)